MELKLNKGSYMIGGQLFGGLPAPVITHIRHLELALKQQESQINQLQAQVKEFQSQINKLEGRLSKDSTNSHKPPSSDGLNRKPQSLREKTGKKPGGQHGHTGKGLSPVSNPDIIISHAPQVCHTCGLGLSQEEGSCYEQRQVFDIPPAKVEVSEHQALEKKCPNCGNYTRASFPETVRGSVQYGEHVQALSTYFSHQHFIPNDRLCQVFKDVFKLPLSAGTCSKINKELFSYLEPFEQSLTSYLLAEPVLYFDESGARCKKKLHWTHVACSQKATLYHFHAKRGQEAIESMGILPGFKGVAVHDEWSPYFAYQQGLHGLCNAHLLRELTFIQEHEKEPWAKQMKDLLIKAKKSVEKYLLVGELPAKELEQIEKQYRQMIIQAKAYHQNLPTLTTGKRGRKKQRAGKNLLDRMEDRMESVLLFTKNFAVNFTNNQSEQDIRMMKVKQKVSGCFRTQEGGEIFCRARSYLSTARKQGWDILEALTQATRGHPYLLTSP